MTRVLLIVGVRPYAPVSTTVYELAVRSRQMAEGCGTALPTADCRLPTRSVCASARAHRPRRSRESVPDHRIGHAETLALALSDRRGEDRRHHMAIAVDHRT